jgi:hypothetical protein
MPARKPPVRTPGSVAVAIVVGMMFVTPVLAATTIDPLSIRWDVLVAFVRAHQLGLVAGFALMIAIASMLKAAGRRPQPPRASLDAMIAEPGPHGIDDRA